MAAFMFNTIAIVTQAKRVTVDQVRVMTSAINQQVKREFAKAYDISGVSVIFHSNPHDIPLDGSAAILTVMDAIDDPQALGYHTESTGQITGKIGVSPVLDNGGSVFGSVADPSVPSVSSVLSHEVLETLADPRVNLWVDGPAINEGQCYAYECCDPVESDQYFIPISMGGIAYHCGVSNFVYQDWFDQTLKAGTQVDYMKRAPGAFQMSPGGYMVVRNGPGSEQQVMGATWPQWKTALKSTVTGRYATRLT